MGKTVRDLEKDKFNSSGEVRIAGSFTADPAVEWTFTDATTSGAYTYYGFQKPDNEWEIKRIDTPLTQMRIANITNNPTQTTYDLAWSNVLILTYEKLGDI